MTAPTRPGTRESRTRQTRTRTTQPIAPHRTPAKPGTGKETVPARSRSAAAERAYQRRAQRSGKVGGSGRVAGGLAPPNSGYQLLAPSPRAPFVMLVMGLLVAGVAATLWLSTQATADSYRLEHAKQAATTLAEQVEQLQSDVAREQAPAALARKARELGMVPAGDPAHLVVGDNGKVRVVGKPQVAKAPTPPPPPVPPAPPQPDPRHDQDTTGDGPRHRAPGAGDDAEAARRARQEQRSAEQGNAQRDGRQGSTQADGNPPQDGQVRAGGGA